MHALQACHPHATEGFTKFYAHPEELDREKYPALFYTYIFMTTLLIGVFTFFFIHTFLWTYRSLKERIKKREGSEPDTGRFYLALDPGPSTPPWRRRAHRALFVPGPIRSSQRPGRQPGAADPPIASRRHLSAELELRSAPGNPRLFPR